jgi:hypothetical protein
MATESGFYSTEVIGRLRAPGQVEQWDKVRLDPSGYRHHESGQYKADSKVLPTLVGGFTAQKESGVPLDFGSIYIEESGFRTNTAVFTFNQGEVNSHPNSYFNEMVAASSVGEFKAFNMRLWQGNLDAFSGLPQPTLYYRNASQWIQNYDLQPSDSGVLILPSSMPLTQNIFSKHPDDFAVSGNFREAEFTHFIYMKGFFPSGSYQLGTYGGLGLDTFTINFSYDYTDLEAFISNPQDITDINIFQSPPLPPSFLGEGVSGHWKLNEKSGTRYASASGFEGVDMNLTPINTPGYASGVLSFAAHFASGSSQRLQMNSNDNWDLRNLDFAIAGWFFFDSLAGQHQGVVGKGEVFFTTDRMEWAIEYDVVRERMQFMLTGSAGERANCLSGQELK